MSRLRALFEQLSDQLRDRWLDNERYRLEVYVVAWLDLLGQGVRLERWVPPNERGGTEEAKLKQEAIRSIRNIQLFRDVARTLARKLSRIQLTAEQRRELSPERQRLAKRYMRIQVSCRCFADSAVLAIPLRRSDQFPPFLSIESMFHQLSIQMLVGLLARNPMRGAISIGLCTLFEKGELYGRALSRARSLEEKANYPRIVVDEDFLDYLKSWQTAEVPDSEKAFNARFLRSLRACLERDPKDGKLILSYLGKAFEEPYKKPEQLSSVCVFIRDAISTASQAGERQLIDKYTYLEEYFKRHGYWLEPSAKEKT